MKQFNKLFEPVKIGKVEVKNRIAMAPMGIVGLANPDGSLKQRAVDYYSDAKILANNFINVDHL